MQPMDALRLAQGGEAIGNVASAFGITPAQAEAALAALLPQVARTMERNSLSRGGLADIVAALGDPRCRNLLDNKTALRSSETYATGIELLEQMLGNKDQSRALAARAAASSGLTETLIKQLLPYLLPMIIGAISKAGSGALGDVLSKIPGLGGDQRNRSGSDKPGFDTGGGFGDGFGLPGPGGGTSPGPRSGGPLPLPGSHTPLGDRNPYSDLSDTIRRGGGAAAGGLFGMIRAILGSLLGFQSRGVIGWLIRLIVFRYGWSILRFIFGRVLLRR